MNDEFSALEKELRALEPLAPSQQLEERISALLGDSPSRSAPATWWQRIGFNRPLAAIGWGVCSPAVAAAVAVMVMHLAYPEPLPSPTRIDGTAKTEEAAGNGLAHSDLPASAKTTNVLYQALDEGVVLDSGQGPVHRVRYRSADLVEWRNPRTGANWEISYPREDVVLVPVQAE